MASSICGVQDRTPTRVVLSIHTKEVIESPSVNVNALCFFPAPDHLLLTFTSMFRSFLVAACAAVASATVELTPDNFDEVVFASGKAAFVKFLAPW